MSLLFTSLMKHASEKEDFFTACIAAALQQDPELCRQFLLCLAGDDIDGCSASGASLNVQTQANFPKAGACVDMVIHVGDQRRIGIEHKLWSPPRKDQLEKYLTLSTLDRLALITGCYVTLQKRVVEDPHYLRPRSGRQHFMWLDFYQLVDRSVGTPSSSELNKELLGLFEHLGFEPPLPEIGDLQHPDPAREAEITRNRKNFAKLWKNTRDGLTEREWKSIEAGNIAELYARNGPSKRLQRVWFDPMWSGSSLRIRLTLSPGADCQEVMRQLNSTNFRYREEVQIVEVNLKGRGKLETTLDILLPLNKLFAGLSDAEEMARRLAEFSFAVIDTATS